MEDFHSLDYIKSHFEVWRKEYANTYRDAYIGLCLPKLFNPLVRLQLITWNPLEVGHGCIISVTSSFFKGNWMRNGDGIFFFSLFTVQAQCANFEYMLWFESLLFYGFEENSTLQKGDGDIGLLPAIVEKVILSKLSGSRHSMLRDVLGLQACRKFLLLYAFLSTLCMWQCWQSRCGTHFPAVKQPGL